MLTEYLENFLPKGVSTQAVTIAVIRTGQSLELTAVAEGAKTERQRQWLQDLQCGVVRGYLYARPLPGAELAGWLNALSSKAEQACDTTGSGYSRP